MQNREIQDKWIAIIILGGLLAALLLSSINISSVVSTAARTGWVSYFPVSQTSDSFVPRRAVASPLAYIVLVSVAGWQVVRAWLKFGHLITHILTNYARNEEPAEQSLLAQFLLFIHPTDKNHSSYPAEILRSLAYAWGVTIFGTGLIELLATWGV